VSLRVMDTIMHAYRFVLYSLVSVLMYMPHVCEWFLCQTFTLLYCVLLSVLWMMQNQFP